ncbi:phosphoenolpyruvate carboxylase, partial [Streptococcus pneumoniae]|uniref:phosphoenolpyruvate carboxylase n=1 Tax=Streptococcus pneumoniae TaxID=1313 RepID=UPI0012D74AAB
DEAGRQAILLKTMGKVKTYDEEKLAPLSRETLGLFRMLRQAIERFGANCIGGHVVSMTRTPSDLLTVLWLWRRACAETPTESPEL